MADDYKDHPVSIGEIRAAREHDASKWSPRDALIAALRAIDKGELKPTYCILSFAVEDNDGSTVTDHYSCIPSTFYGVGLLHATIRDFTRGK